MVTLLLMMQLIMGRWNQTHCKVKSLALQDMCSMNLHSRKENINDDNLFLFRQVQMLKLLLESGADLYAINNVRMLCTMISYELN